MRYIVRRQTSASAESALPSEETDITSKEPADHERPDQPQASGRRGDRGAAVLSHSRPKPPPVGPELAWP